MSTPPDLITSPSSGTATYTRVHGHRLTLLRLIWTLLTVLVLALVLAGMPMRYAAIEHREIGLLPSDASGNALLDAGVPPHIVATYEVGLGIYIFLVFFIPGLVLFWRSSDSWLITFASLTLILMGANFSIFLQVHMLPSAILAQPAIGFMATSIFFLVLAFEFVALFWLPDGRFVPRWTAYLVTVCLFIIAVILFFIPFPRSLSLVNIPVALPLIVIGIWTQFYRSRRVANPVQRQQIKWVVVGIVVVALGFFVWQILSILLLNQDGTIRLVISIISRFLLVLSLTAVPVCAGIAILRYRLWDVDLALNRSLVYGAVTIVLALVFLGSAFLLQSILGSANSSAVIAVSVVGAGFLFNPARKQAQHFVDRRLYGFRFDLNELHEAQQQAEIKNPGALTGHTLGDYRLLGVLGKGGMGEVYQGEGNGQTVAIKILPDELAIQDEFRKRFEREAETLAAFDHPNIVKTYGYGASDGVHYMAMEYINGQELSDLIKQRGRIPWEDVRPYITDFAAALAYAHAQGLVHRDIKPSNIMLRQLSSDSFQAVLMDFGIAKLQDARTALTGSGAVGTIDYIAPEQIMAAREVDQRADIYALGVVLYEMLTGERPFKGSAGQVLFAHLQQPPPDPRDLVSDLPSSVAKAIMKAMAKKPEDRFQTVDDLATALQ